MPIFRVDLVVFCCCFILAKWTSPLIALCFEFFIYIYRHVKEDEEENVELDDIVYDIEESDDKYIDETDPEECGSGLIKKVTADDSSNLYLIWLKQK